MNYLGSRICNDDGRTYVMLGYDKIKDYYDRNLWTKEMVRNAVIMKKINEKEYKEITGEDYI